MNVGCRRIVLKALRGSVSQGYRMTEDELLIPSTWYMVDSRWHRVKDASDESSAYSTHLEVMRRGLRDGRIWSLFSLRRLLMLASEEWLMKK